MAASAKPAVSSSMNDDPEALDRQHDEEKLPRSTLNKLPRSSFNSQEQKSHEEVDLASLLKDQSETPAMNEEFDCVNRSRSRPGSRSRSRPGSRSSHSLDEEIDFCSPKFNAALALKSENVTVPSPNILTYESLSSYEDAVNRRRQQRKSTATLTMKNSQDDTKMLTLGSSSRELASRSLDSKLKNRSGKSGTQGTKGDKNTPESFGLKNSSATRSTSRSRSLSMINKQFQQCEKGTYGFRSTTPEDKSSHKGLQRVCKEKFDNQKRPSTLATLKPESDVTVEVSTSSQKHGRRQRRNVFTRMEEVSGPLSLLTRCVKDKEHVRVVTRGAVALHSICRGYIVAFDKYFNMAMIDVDEIYRRPAEMGKVKARISHRLLDAQQTLKKERDECQARWRSKFSQRNTDGKTTINFNPEKSHNLLTRNLEESKQFDIGATKSSKREQQSFSDVGSSERLSQCSAGLGTALGPGDESQKSSGLGAAEAESSRLSKLNLRLLQSVYSSLSTPLSRYEREALMLGIPDENVEHRHLNQLLLRGENIVSVSIIEEF